VLWVTLERTWEKSLVVVELSSSFEFFVVVTQLLRGLCCAAQ